MKKLQKITLIGLCAFLFTIIVGLSYYFCVTASVRLDAEKLTLNEKQISVLDENGEPIQNVSTLISGQTVSIDQIPKHTQNAFVCVEDKRFYKHSGYDVKRIAKAVWNNLKARSFKEGASTISQQLIKNTHLSQEKTVKRKLREWKLTRQLEKEYSKDEILEKYLNTIYFGHSCFGIRSAADFYFGKTVSELSLSDSALLAGLVRSPNNYSPFKNETACKNRRSTVLNLMYTNGKITEAEKNQAAEAPISTANERNGKNKSFLHFVFDELSSIAEEYSLTIGGKIEISTGLDCKLQAHLESLLDTDCDKTALVLDLQCGNFKACVSTLGNLPRLPGSIIKPLLVYAPALEENLLSPATPILDEPINYAGYRPQNYDGAYHGYVSARECLEKSLNIPAVKILQSLGVKKGAEYLAKLGLKTDEDERSLALALGGMKQGFTLQELALAYSALPTGTFKPCGFIQSLKIDGVQVYERPNTERKVFSKETAFLITDMLRTTSKNGTAKKLRSLPFEIAAKTGTVGTEKGNTDAYALSYTANDLTAVWLGNADNTVIPHTGGGLPCNLVLQINEYLHSQRQAKKLPSPTFKKPNGIQSLAIDKIAYYDTHNILLADDFSPSEYRFYELFKKDAPPLKKSDFFSNPSISTPTVTFENNAVYITFDKGCSPLYGYKIIRYNYATHTTVYQGDFTPIFIDDTIQPNKRYLYTVVPFYKNNEGKAIPLPAVNTTPPAKQDKITEMDWWKY